MKTAFTKKLSSFILCTALIVAMAFTTAGCNGKSDNSASNEDARTENTVQDDTSASDENSSQDDASVSDESGSQDDTSVSDENNSQSDARVLGEGSTQFLFRVTDPDGNETDFEIHTDKETVGEALSELGLIEGEEGQYGLYIKTVNGITADYDKDGIYWAFYINDEYAQEGVDFVSITEGDVYSFKAEKG